MKRYQEAVVAYDRSLALNPNLSYHWACKGHALRALGRFQEALSAYDRSLALEPRAYIWACKSRELGAQRRQKRRSSAPECWAGTAGGTRGRHGGAMTAGG